MNPGPLDTEDRPRNVKVKKKTIGESDSGGRIIGADILTCGNMTGLIDAFESGGFPNLGRLCIDFCPNNPVEGRSRYRMLETNGNKNGP